MLAELTFTDGLQRPRGIGQTLDDDRRVLRVDLVAGQTGHIHQRLVLVDRASVQVRVRNGQQRTVDR